MGCKAESVLECWTESTRFSVHRTFNLSHMLQGLSWQRYVHLLMGCALSIWVVEAKCQEGGPTFWFWINRAPVSDTGLVYGGLRTSTPEADIHQMQPDYVYTAPTIKLVRIEQNATIIKNSYDLLHQTNSTRHWIYSMLATVPSTDVEWWHWIVVSVSFNFTCFMMDSSYTAVGICGID